MVEFIFWDNYVNVFVWLEFNCLFVGWYLSDNLVIVFIYYLCLKVVSICLDLVIFFLVVWAVNYLV